MPREARPRGVLCPFCGEVSPDLKRCRGCRAFLDPLSRQASQNQMGPWAIRDPLHPFRPGCSYETIRKLAATGRINATTVIRGPTTRQSWLFAARTPAVANLLGLCHNCQREVDPHAAACPACGASFVHDADRQVLGLAPVHLLPGEASPESIASAVTPAASAPPFDRVAPAASVTESPSRSEPDATAVLAAARRHIGRMRAVIAVLAVLVLGLGAVVGAMLAGWRPMTEWRERSPTAADSPRDGGEAGGGRLHAAEKGVPSEPPPAASPPALPGAEPQESPPPPVPADPVKEPVEPPVAAPPTPPAASGRVFRDRILAMLAADPPDASGALAACDAMAAADPSFDPEPWRRLIDGRAACAPLRALP